MNPDDTPDYEYEYSLDECNSRNEYASGYKSDYSPPKFDYDPEPKATKEELIIYKAYWTIRKNDSNNAMTDEQCMKVAFDWYVKKFGEFK